MTCGNHMRHNDRASPGSHGSGLDGPPGRSILYAVAHICGTYTHPAVSCVSDGLHL